MTSSTWSTSWTDGSLGNPRESYSIKCVASGSACRAATQGTPAIGIARGTNTGMVTGLASDSTYTCYVIAMTSQNSICSQPTSITTL